MDVVKSLAKQIVDLFYKDAGLAARFSVVSFNATARIRVDWSTDDAEIDAAIDAISPNGDTSISAGLNLAEELFDNARVTATKVVLLLSDGKQDVDLGGSAAAINASQTLRDDGAKVFAWGFGMKIDASALEGVAGDASRVRYASDVSGLSEYIHGLESDVCDFSPPTSPPPPPSLPAAPARHSHLASSSFYVSPIATLSASCPARPRMLLLLWLVFVL